MAEAIAAAPTVTVKMARRVIAHLAEPEIRSSMADELVYQTFINKSDDYAELRAARAEERPPKYTGADHGRPAGLPEPPGGPVRFDGTFDGTTVAVTGGGTGLGKAIASEFARLGATIAILSRKEEHLAANREAIGALGATVHTETCDIRRTDQIAAAFDGIEAAVGRPSVLINNAAANFPVPAEDMSPNAWRTVVDITLNGTFFCARELAAPAPGRRHARLDRERRRVPARGPAARASPTAPPPRPASRTWSRRSPWSGVPTASR